MRRGSFRAARLILPINTQTFKINAALTDNKNTERKYASILFFCKGQKTPHARFVLFAVKVNDMNVFYICSGEVKSFMNKILRETFFDNFELRNVEIQSFAKFDIDGRINQKFMAAQRGADTPENTEEFFCKWGKIKPYVFELVKGKTKPVYMKFIISAPKNVLSQVSDNAAALFLNFVFENDMVVCTAGTSQKTFSLNKELELAWAEYVTKFFKNIGVAVKKEM